MLVLISPAKTLDFETLPITKIISVPSYLDDSQHLINCARRYSVRDITEIMGVSEKIAELNFQRFKNWHTPFTPNNAKQAILAFKGDVYTGLDAESLNAKDFQFAQKHLRILSGLYGLLRPLDLIQAYRLEMGRKIPNGRGKNLYEFWGNTITDGINLALEQTSTQFLINLASIEYFKSVKPKILNAEIITPLFKDYHNGQYKIMGVYAKKARGMLSRYIIKNKIGKELDEIKKFAEDGYHYCETLSDQNNWVFTRKKEV